MSTIRSFSTAGPGSGSIVTLGPTSSARTLQASWFRPLINIASDPQIPWAHRPAEAEVPS
jgi:hypothetical protein